MRWRRSNNCGSSLFLTNSSRASAVLSISISACLKMLLTLSWILSKGASHPIGSNSLVFLRWGWLWGQQYSIWTASQSFNRSRRSGIERIRSSLIDRAKYVFMTNIIDIWGSVTVAVWRSRLSGDFKRGYFVRERWIRIWDIRAVTLSDSSEKDGAEYQK